MLATTAMVMMASDADDGNHDNDDHHHRDHDDAVLYNAALALMQGGGQGHAAAFKLLARCSYVQVSSSNTHLHWTNAGPRHTHRLPALSLPQRCSFFYWLRVCECCTHVCRFPCCRSRVIARGSCALRAACGVRRGKRLGDVCVSRYVRYCDCPPFDAGFNPFPR